MVIEDQRRTNSEILLLKAEEQVLIFALELSFPEELCTQKKKKGETSSGKHSHTSFHVGEFCMN